MLTDSRPSSIKVLKQSSKSWFLSHWESLSARLSVDSCIAPACIPPAQLPTALAEVRELCHGQAQALEWEVSQVKTQGLSWFFAPLSGAERGLAFPVCGLLQPPGPCMAPFSGTFRVLCSRASRPVGLCRGWVSEKPGSVRRKHNRYMSVCSELTWSIPLSGGVQRRVKSVSKLLFWFF